jgi:hypothetical protein
MTGSDGNKRKCYVYGISVDGVIRYVGKATHSNKQSRFKRHMWQVRKLIASREIGAKFRPLQPKLYYSLASAIEKGSEIKEIVFADGLDDKSAFEIEIKLIANMMPDNRLNILPGGEGMTSEYAKSLWECEETKAKMRKAFKGRVLSEEGRKRMAESRKGRVISQDHREKLRKAFKGRPRGEEISKKISEGRTGCKIGPEGRANIAKGVKERFARERSEGKVPANAKPVITPNGRFESASAAAAVYGLSIFTAAKRARKGWMGWSYTTT